MKKQRKNLFVKAKFLSQVDEWTIYFRKEYYKELILKELDKKNK